MINKILTNLPYRPCVGIVLFNNDNQVFIARRNDVGRQSWQFPQGGINSGEEPEAAALRELEEETNIKSVRLSANIVSPCNKYLIIIVKKHNANTGAVRKVS